ncbi:MAG: c-type cytochrome [Nitrospinaceae bacterium]
MENQENKDNEYVPVEKVSFSFLFFLISGAALLVTVWAFWDDEFSRRGFKEYQEEFFKTEYARAEEKWKKANQEISDKEKEIKESLSREEGRLEKSKEYQNLVARVNAAQIALDDVKEEKKFAGSRLDEAYYYYKKAMHLGENYDVQLAKVNSIEGEIKNFDPIIAQKQKELDDAENALLAFKIKEVKLKKELITLTSNREQLERKMKFYKPFPFFWKPSEIKQTVIPGFGKNAFSEIIYRVDRCMTCHISYKDPYYKDFEEPLRSHPNLDLLIKKHPPEKTGCTWCHLGQGTATAPPEDAHGSHHENDQTAEINEPILKGHFMESNCRNCHAEVVDLEGAPVLSKGKKLFLKLGCHGCHLAEGYGHESKVGPRLVRIASKVNPSWLYRWVKDPKAYLPKTRMPNFGFNDKDALAVVAYLMSSSQKDYRLADKFESGEPEKGKKLFETLGCYGCHELNGKGEVFGPDLSRIAGKVNADWLVTWLSNPKHYNEKSIMPDLRLSKEEASNLTAFLLQFGKPKHIPGIEKRIFHPKLIKYGERVIRRRGCFACHDIKGMESEGRIAPELSSFGRKLILELEFGDSHIPHTWEAWVRTKLKNPSAFRTERVLDKMPNFQLAPDEIDALVVLLKGFNGTKVPERYRKILTEKEKILETGRRLITKYNCRGCHHIEGVGGRIQKYIPARANYPPPLENGPYHVGERIKASWLFSFLQNPTPVRTWVKVRMPTFNLTDKEVRDLTAYFEALAPMEIKYEAGINLEKENKIIQLGSEIVNYMDCGKCHDDGAKGIDFSIASERLRQDWIPRWLERTRELIPWTRMPAHWDKKGDKFVVKKKFELLKQVGDLDDQLEAIKDFIVAYNTADIDFDRVLGEEPSSDQSVSPGDEESLEGEEEGAEDEEDMGGDEDEEFFE